MDEILRRLNGGQAIGLVAVVFGIVGLVIVTVTGIIVPLWQRVRLAEAETQLKRDLVAAGYSAVDIERIVAATAQRAQPRTESANSSANLSAADWS